MLFSVHLLPKAVGLTLAALHARLVWAGTVWGIGHGTVVYRFRGDAVEPGPWGSRGNMVLVCDEVIKGVSIA